MLEILEQLCLQKKMVSIYTNYQDLNKFHFGRVLAVNEKEIAIQMISPDGEDDGISVMNVENVIRVETNGQYAEKMKKLYSSNSISSYKLSVKDGKILLSVLSLAIEKKQIISIELLDSGYNDVVGFVQTVEEEKCKIKQIDEYGYEDGFSYILVNNITKISFLTQDEKRIMKLWQKNIKNTGDGSVC